MTILLEQFRKISTFALLLAILFLANIFFNINFKWSGISLIVRVYIFLLSFLVIYNFSLIDIEKEKEGYHAKYGRRGLYYLFIVSRVVPFILIYAITIVFTLIDYLDRPEWFINSVIDLLKGRYANTIIYSLILLIILKIRRDPLVTIPLFLAASLFYLMVLDKMVDNYFPEGAAVSIIKIVKYVVFVFFLIFEFFFEKKKIVIPALLGTAIGVVIHFCVTGVIYLFYTLSPDASHTQFKSARLLLHTGFSFPFETMVETAKKEKTPIAVGYAINYSKLYGLEIRMSDEEWGQLIDASPLKTVEMISAYLLERRRLLSYDTLMAYAEKYSRNQDSGLASSNQFIRYMAMHMMNSQDDFLERISGGNVQLLLWGMQILGEAKCTECMPFLINYLTDLNPEISVAAYRTLTIITGIDPAQKDDFHSNSPAVITRFREFYRDYRKGLQ